MDIQSVILEAKFNPGLFILMLALVFLSAFFSMSETAFSSVSDVKIRVAVEDRKAGSKKALYLIEHFDRTLTTLLIGNNLVNVALSTIAVTFFTELALSEEWVSLVSTLSVTLVLLLFGEIIPKMIAKQYPDGTALKVSWIVYIFSIIFFIFSAFFIGIQKLISRKEDEDEIDEDELTQILNKMEEEETISSYEVKLINNVLDLNDRTVEDILVPRIKMDALDYNSTLEEVKDFMENNSFSRIPVYKKDRDHIIGVLYERDFYPAILKNPRASWKRLIRPVKFVAASMKVDALIQELQKTKTHIAIVSGEWGDVLGLVTMEDALEELLGEIYDEHDVPGDNDLFFKKESDDSYIIDGEYFVDDLFEKLNLGDIPEDVPNKMSSWLFAKCESLPKVGFSIQYLANYTRLDEESGEYEDFSKMLTLSIYEVENRRITRVKIELHDATDEEIEKYNEEQEE